MLSITLPDGTTKNAFPLVPAQQLLMYLHNRYGGKTPVLNIVLGHYWQGEIDIPVMKAAIQEACDRCDAARIRFTQHPLYKVVQYTIEEPAVEVEEEDYSDLTLEEAHARVKERSFSLSPLFDAPLRFISIVHFPDGYNGLCMKLQHMAFDGYSVKLFLKDIIDIYEHKTTGAPYPKPMRLYMDALAKEFEYIESDRHTEDLNYWIGTAMNPTEPIYNDYVHPNRLFKERTETNQPNLRCAELPEDDGETGSLRYILSPEDTRQLFDFCKQNDVSFFSFLNMMVRTAFSVFNENEKDISVKLMLNRRATLLEKRSGGARMHFVNYRTIVEPETTFMQALRLLEAKETETYKHCNLSSIELIQSVAQAQKRPFNSAYESMILSYHPLFELPVPGEKGVKTNSISRWYNDELTMFGIYLTVMHRVSDDGLNFSFAYRVKSHPVEQLPEFFDIMMGTMRLGLANPNITIGEILEKLHIQEDA